MSNDPGMVKAVCQRCGASIPLGRAKYEIHVEVVADFDGYLPDIEDTEEEIERVLGEADAADRTELEDDVHQEFSLTLCRTCMRDVVREIRTSSKGTPTGALRRRFPIQ